MHAGLYNLHKITVRIREARYLLKNSGHRFYKLEHSVELASEVRGLDTREESDTVGRG